MNLELALMLADEARSKGAEARSLHEAALIALADAFTHGADAVLSPNGQVGRVKLAKGPTQALEPGRMSKLRISDDAKHALRDYPSGLAATQE